MKNSVSAFFERVRRGRGAQLYCLLCGLRRELLVGRFLPATAAEEAETEKDGEGDYPFCFLIHSFLSRLPLRFCSRGFARAADFFGPADSGTGYGGRETSFPAGRAGDPGALHAEAGGNAGLREREAERSDFLRFSET